MAERSAALRNMALTCAFYTLSSAGMSVFNKMAVMALPLPITLVMVQMVFTVATICANWRSVQIGSRRDALRWGCTVPLLFSGMLVSSMFAMEHNTLGTVVVFRNVAPLFTLLIERLFRVPMQVSRDTILALLTVVLGVVLYHRQALELSGVGFIAIVCNMVFAVLERLLQRHLMAQDPVDISKPGMMLLNNACGLAPNLLLLLVYQEPPRWAEVWGGLGTRGYVMIALSCLNGLAISYAGLRVQQLVTATSFMVLTNVNKVLVVIFGVVALGDPITPTSGFGVCIAIGGGLWYAQERKRLDEAARRGGGGGDIAEEKKDQPATESAATLEEGKGAEMKPLEGQRQRVEKH